MARRRRPAADRGCPRTRETSRRSGWGDVAGVGQEQDLDDALDRRGDRDHATTDRAGHADAVVARLALAGEPAALRSARHAERRAEPAALGRPTCLGTFVPGAGARLGSARTDAADHCVGPSPPVRIASRSAITADLVPGLHVEVEGESALERGEDPGLLRVGPSERIETGRRRTSAGWPGRSRGAGSCVGRPVLRRRCAGVDRDHVDCRRAMRRRPPFDRLAAGPVGQGVNPGEARRPVAPGPARGGARALVARRQRSVPVATCSPVSEDHPVCPASNNRDHRVERVALGDLVGSGVLWHGARDSETELLGERPLAEPIVGRSIGGGALDEARVTRLVVEGSHRGALRRPPR